MANKSERRRRQAEKKKAAKAAQMLQPGMKSAYARKQSRPVGVRLAERETRRREERYPGDFERMARHRMVPEDFAQPSPPDPHLTPVDRWRLALFGEGALERHALWGRP